MNVIQTTSATSGTITAQDSGQDVILIHDASATVTMTVAFPATPTNGQQFIFCSVGGITTLTMTTATGTIATLLTTIAAGGTSKYIYVTAPTKWYKI